MVGTMTCGPWPSRAQWPHATAGLVNQQKLQANRQKDPNFAGAPLQIGLFEVATLCLDMSSGLLMSCSDIRSSRTNASRAFYIMTLHI